MIIVAALVLAIGVVTDSATATDEGLVTGCAPMNFVVENLREKHTATGLTEKAIENAVEARLRMARSFAPTAAQTNNRERYLYVNLNIVGRVFSIDVQLVV